MERLIVLNLGIDVLCSMVYSGDFIHRGLEMRGVTPEDFTIPLMCNAFSVFGKSAGGGHYFGRDFMFPTAGVFQDTAAMIIYNPVHGTEKDKFGGYPFISVTAPGMAGCISAMNSAGTGIGVDMSPGANCSPESIGVNSLLLTRMCVQYRDSAAGMVELIRDTPRGVSWNYVIADGKKDRACVAEAGTSLGKPDFTQFPADEMKAFLPDSEFIQNNRTAEFENGLMVRWNDYKYPDAYLEFNRLLWDKYNKIHSTDKKLRADAFSGEGYINSGNSDKNCPSSFYFAPQREDNDELVIVTNHYLIPEMRYYAMHPWTYHIVGDIINDIQWRYDELNHQILRVLKVKGHIDYQDAKRLISFLSPSGMNPSYYKKNPKSKDGKQIRIEGCMSVFDLKNGTVESHYGYYCDQWVKLTLKNYIGTGG